MVVVVAAVVMQHACLLREGVVGEVEVDLSLCCSQKEAGVEEEGDF